MRRIVLLLASAALAVLFISANLGSRPTAAQTTPVKPNFVFILTDDMRKDDLKYMPKTRALLGDEGMRFENAYVSLAWCCPSRATIMRGQYAHNTGVWFNAPGPDGGWQGYRDHGNEQDNIATRLQGAGYRTGLFGKYLNFYDGSAEPPGWDDWFATFQPGSQQASYFDYDVNDNGTIKHYGTQPSDYNTDVISVQTQDFISTSVSSGEPFFAYVAARAPHEVAIPAPRHQNTFDGEKAPRLTSFNEEDVSDKPPWIQSLPRLTATQINQIDARHKRRVESLQAVDELVEAVVGNLRSNRALDNTYVVFTSDNGWYHGEHRIPNSKGRPYEESIHMPLLIRGPGVQAGLTTNSLILNTDYFPTFTDLAGVPTPDYVDGRSFRPLLERSATTWRTAILLEERRSSSQTFSGIRTSDGWKYIEYEGGFKELYDLKNDANELESKPLAGNEQLYSTLQTRLNALRDCSGAVCRANEWDTKVISTIPKANAIAVAPTANVRATFSEDMMPSSINTTTFKLMEQGSTTKISATISYEASTDTATLNPTNSLQSGVTYKAVITTGAKDVAGNPLDQNPSVSGNQQKAWTFTVQQ